ncbi:MAG: tetratricopeptide repeat protein, partial [Chitinivibrionales bacterium]|nr:tetratricopeptide repeat protein [Chitinivibrionales bacterium]
ALERYAAFLAGRAEYPAASKIYKRIAKLPRKTATSLSGDFLMQWAESCRRAGSFSEALGLYERVKAKSPNVPQQSEINYHIAECQLKNGDFALAVLTLQKLVAADSTSPFAIKALLKIGDLYYNKQLFPSAVAAYRRYLMSTVAPDKDKVHYILAAIYRDRYKKNGAALREFEYIVQHYPAGEYFYKALYSSANCYETLQDFPAALRTYEYLAESEAPRDLAEKSRSRISYIKTFCIAEPRAAASALASLFAAANDSVTTAERLWQSALILERDLKQYEEALPLYQRLFTRDSATTADSLKRGALLHSAQIYEKLGEKARFENDSDRGRVCLEQAIALYKTICLRFAGMDVVDEAAFRLLIITSPEIGQFEAYVREHAASVHVSEALFKIGEYYARLCNANSSKPCLEAIGAFRRIVDAYNASAFCGPAAIALARIFMDQKQFDSARVVLNNFLASHPDSRYEPQALYSQGLLLQEQRHYAQAVDQFKKVLARFPQHPASLQARYALAVSQMSLGNFADALGNLRTYLQNPSVADSVLAARYYMALSLRYCGQFEEAAAILTDLLAQGPLASREALINAELARIAERKGDAYAALRRYKLALTGAGLPNLERAAVLTSMGRLYFEAHIFAEASGAYNDAFKFAANRADSSTMLRGAIIAMVMDGRLKSAVPKIKLFNDRFGDDIEACADIVYYEGLCSVVEKKYNDAIKAFKIIISKYKTSRRLHDAYYQIALCNFYDNKKDVALTLFYDFLKKFDHDEYVPSVNFKIGMIYHEQNDYAQAADYFVRVLNDSAADSKTRFRAAYNAAIDYQKFSSWEDAAGLYKRIALEFPGEVNSSATNLKAGFCLLQASHYEEALKYFQRADQDPDPQARPEIAYWTAFAIAQMGEDQRAIAEYLKVPSLSAEGDAWGITSEYEAARLCERIGDLKKARALYQKIVKADSEAGKFGKQALQRLNNLTSEN